MLAIPGPEKKPKPGFVLSAWDFLKAIIAQGMGGKIVSDKRRKTRRKKNLSGWRTDNPVCVDSTVLIDIDGKEYGNRREAALAGARGPLTKQVFRKD